MDPHWATQVVVTGNIDFSQAAARAAKGEKVARTWATPVTPPLWGQIKWYPQGKTLLDNYLDKIVTLPKNHVI